MKITLPQYLYHYYEAAYGPFHNLSALSDEEAQRVSERIRQEGKGFASRRSPDYWTIRRDLEQRARALFLQKGGTPKSTYPHYMTLGACCWLEEWYDDAKAVKIELDAFRPGSISFTYGDLFPTMRHKDGKSYREQLYIKEEIAGVIQQYGLPQEWNQHGQHGPERYIEVQIWDDEVIGKYF